MGKNNKKINQQLTKKHKKFPVKAHIIKTKRKKNAKKITLLPRHFAIDLFSRGRLTFDI